MSYLWKSNTTNKSSQLMCQKIHIINLHKQNKKPDHASHSQASAAIKKRKRYRSAFTTSQVAILEDEFKKAPYVNNLRREQLATSLCLPERAIKIWFQNRRMKEKRETSSASEVDEKKTPIMGEINIESNESRHKTLNNVEEKHEAIKPLAKSISKLTNVCGEKKSTIGASTSKSHLKVPEKTNEIGSSSIPESRTSNVERRHNVSEKQPIGHVQPFSQVPVIQSQKPQQNISTANETTKQQEAIAYSHYVRAFGADPQGNLQIPPQLPFSGLIPVLPPDAPSLQIFAGLQPPPFQMDLGLARKCCCDCHRPDVMAAMSAANLQVSPFFYTHYLPQFLTSAPPTRQF